MAIDRSVTAITPRGIIINAIVQKRRSYTSRLSGMIQKTSTRHKTRGARDSRQPTYRLVRVSRTLWLCMHRDQQWRFLVTRRHRVAVLLVHYSYRSGPSQMRQAALSNKKRAHRTWPRRVEIMKLSSHACPACGRATPRPSAFGNEPCGGEVLIFAL